jgi:hypothetical protein
LQSTIQNQIGGNTDSEEKFKHTEEEENPKKKNEIFRRQRNMPVLLAI